MKSFGQKPWILPQPVLILGTYNNDGTPNAMNAAWGGQWDAKEILISMGSHVTTENLNRSGEFTVAFATKKTMVASDFVGIVSAKNDPQKIQKTGWTTIKAENVDAPVISEYPLTLECKLISYDNETERLIGEVVNTIADDSILTDGKIDLSKFHPITYDCVNHHYIALGEKVGNAFKDGNSLKI